LGDPQTRGELHARNEQSQVDGEARPVTNPGVAEHLEELTLIKPKMSLSCRNCIYQTNYLTRSMAKRRLHNHRCKNHPRDPNNNPEMVVTIGMAREAVQRNHKGKVPNPPENDDFENVPDTHSSDDSKSGSCMEVHSDADKR
jgi:hypothetical protein